MLCNICYVFSTIAANLPNLLVDSLLVLDQVTLEQGLVLAVRAGKVLLLPVDIPDVFIHVDHSFPALLAVFKTLSFALWGLRFYSPQAWRAGDGVEAWRKTWLSSAVLWI